MIRLQPWMANLPTLDDMLAQLGSTPELAAAVTAEVEEETGEHVSDDDDEGNYFGAS